MAKMDADFDSQIRIAFAKVKEDVRSLRESIESTRRRVDSVQLSLSQYPDKHEFYEFVKSLRSELDSMHASLVKRKDLDELSQLVRKHTIALDQKQAAINDLEATLKEKTSKNELKRHEELADNANKELAIRLLKMERAYERMRDDFSDVKKELRLKSRQLETLKERQPRVVSTRTVSNAASEPFTFPKIPKAVLIGIPALILLIVFFIAIAPKFNETTIPYNQTSNQTIVAPSNDTELKNMECLAEFECKELSPDSYYAGCKFDCVIDNGVFSALYLLYDASRHKPVSDCSGIFFVLSQQS